ncbi:MAG: C40 family peptidase [Pseudomonadota bacterium]
MSQAHVLTPSAWLYETSDNQAHVSSQLLHGEDVDILSSQGAFHKIKAARDGYEGWVRSDALTQGPAAPTHTVCVPSAPMYRLPDFKAEPVLTLPLNARVRVTGAQTEENPAFLPTDSGFVPARHVCETPLNQPPHEIARAFLGTPYAWAGRTYHGIDCSGLIQMALWARGEDCPRDSGPQWQTLGRTLDAGEAPDEGDLVFFPGHVGFYVGGGQLLHANATHMRTTIDPLEEVISWVARESDTPLLGFKRLS